MLINFIWVGMTFVVFVGCWVDIIIILVIYLTAKAGVQSEIFKHIGFSKHVTLYVYKPCMVLLLPNGSSVRVTTVTQRFTGRAVITTAIVNAAYVKHRDDRHFTIGI